MPRRFPLFLSLTLVCLTWLLTLSTSQAATLAEVEVRVPVALQAEIQEGPLPLALYPTPPNDNGWGMHFSPAAARVEPEVVDLFTHELQTLGIKWVVVLNDGLSPQQDELVARLVGLQMEPILRIYTQHNDPLDEAALRSLVQHYSVRGVRYFQLYNEPNLLGVAGGWRDGEAISVEHMVDVWLPAARVVQEAGGIPTTPPLAPGGHHDDMDFFRRFLGEIQTRGAEEIFYSRWSVEEGQARVWRYGAVLNVHNYGLNHPPRYPDDTVSQSDAPLNEAEIAAYGGAEAGQVEAVNRWRATHRDPAARTDGGTFQGNTLQDDSNGFRKLEAYYQEFTTRFGFEVPLLGTEGGWLLGEQQDQRYLPVSEQVQATWTLEALVCLLTEGCVPDAVFVHSTWIMANYAANGVTPHFEPQALYRKRCYVQTPPAQARAGDAAWEACAEGDVLAVVRTLADSPLKNQVRPTRALRPAWTRGQSQRVGQGLDQGLLDILRAEIPLHEDAAYLDQPLWERVRAVAQAAGDSPQAVLAALFPEYEPGTPIESFYRISSSAPHVQIEQRASEVHLTNITAQMVPISVQGQTYTIAPYGSVVIVLPQLSPITIPLAARRAPTGPDLSTIQAPAPSTSPYAYEVAEIYHFSCLENNQMTLLQVRVVDEQHQPLSEVPLHFATADESYQVREVSGVKEPGLTEFALVAPGGGNWKVRVADEAGASSWAENLRTDLWDESCPEGVEGNTWGHHSYRVTFRRTTRRAITQAPPATTPAPTEQGGPALAVLTADGFPVNPATGWRGTWQPEAFREVPAAPWSPAQVRPLTAWPRPAQDSGVGLHYVPVGGVTEEGVRAFIADLQHMHMSWATVLYGGEETLQIAAPLFREAGIMVLWRPFRRAHQPYFANEIARDLAILREAGMPPYIQIYNEPELGVEWEGADDILPQDRDALYIENWLRVAREIWKNGGFPGIQTTDPELLRALLGRVKADAPYLLSDIFFVPHAYGLNHPPSYPYDAINQAEHPGATIDQDWTAALGFLKFAHIFQEEVGFIAPMIVGEGGWTMGVLEDDRYPRIDQALHRDYHREMADTISAGRLPTGETLPPELLGVTWWHYQTHPGSMGFAADAWFRSPLHGTLTDTITALHQRPVWQRHYSTGETP